MPETVEPDPWLHAARQYSRLDDAGRLAYWSQLGPEQKAALTAALHRVSAPAPTPSAAPVAAAAPVKKGGPFSVAAVGCLGFVVGAILVVVAQIAGLRSLLPELLSPSPKPQSSSTVDPTIEYLNSDCNGPPKSLEEEYFCRAWRQEHPEP